MRRADAGTTVWEKGFHLCVEQSNARLNALTLIDVLTPQTSGRGIGTTRQKPFINSITDALAAVVAAGEMLLMMLGAFFFKHIGQEFRGVGANCKGSSCSVTSRPIETSWKPSGRGLARKGNFNLCSVWVGESRSKRSISCKPLSIAVRKNISYYFIIECSERMLLWGECWLILIHSQ